MENLNVKISKRGDRAYITQQSLKELIDKLFKPSDISFCSNQSIKQILTDNGLEAKGYQISNYLKQISTNKIIRTKDGFARGWMVEFTPHLNQ